jgi:hypothetical protein
MRTENPCFKKRGVNSSPVPGGQFAAGTESKSFYLLPYHHLELVKFEAGEGQDTLTLSFLNRTVLITGKNLRELGLALQDRCVEFVKPMPVFDRYSSLASDECFVKTIEIKTKGECSCLKNNRQFQSQAAGDSTGAETKTKLRKKDSSGRKRPFIWASPKSPLTD